MECVQKVIMVMSLRRKVVHQMIDIIGKKYLAQGHLHIVQKGKKNQFFKVTVQVIDRTLEANGKSGINIVTGQKVNQGTAHTMRKVVD